MDIQDENQAEPAIRPEEDEAAATAGETAQAVRDAGMQTDFSREQWILTHIGDENLMEYLRMEQKKEEDVRKAKEARQKVSLGISAYGLTCCSYYCYVPFAGKSDSDGKYSLYYCYHSGAVDLEESEIIGKGMNKHEIFSLIRPSYWKTAASL